MVDISPLIHNLAIQIFSLMFGIIAGLIIGWLSAEEIPHYQKQLGFLSLVLSSVTFALPFLFIEKWIPLAIVGGTYALLTLLQKEKERFFLLSPLVLFLTAEESTVFFLCSVFVFAATGVMTLRILASFVKEKKLVFNKKSQPEQSSGVFFKPRNKVSITAAELRGIKPISSNKKLAKTLFDAYAQFVAVTIILYAIAFFA